MNKKIWDAREIYNYEGPHGAAWLSLSFAMAYNGIYHADVKVAGPFAYLRGVWAASGDDPGQDEEGGIPWPTWL